MTDLKKFIDTYKQFGIDIKTFEKNDRIIVELNGWDKSPTISDKFEGYTGFYSSVEFTKNGQFISQGFWE